jgi:hypothetical protein
VKKHRFEILIGILGVLVAISVWLFPPEPLRGILGIKNSEESKQNSDGLPSAVASFTGTAGENSFRDDTSKGPADFMDYIENHIGEIVYFDVEVDTNQMYQLNQSAQEGNSKIYTLVVGHPTLNYWFEINMTVEPSDDFFYGPVSVAYGYLRGHFRIMGRYGIGTGVSGFELQAVQSP